MLKKKITALFLGLLVQVGLFGAAHADSPIGKNPLQERRPLVRNSSAATVADKRQNATLYNANCAICHGQAKRGQSPSLVRNAIRNNTGGMGSLKFLSQEQVDVITDF
ncbi:cytochrome c [Geotalea sp. SG265]|uniref:c-type cytochrome n=1 Tax=Geotalea sp. SG265 TaxID=2922867 RepID=UPI001FAFF29E|nr:cytochrome c [Geotalea sp. SG265]